MNWEMLMGLILVIIIGFMQSPILAALLGVLACAFMAFSFADIGNAFKVFFEVLQTRSGPVQNGAYKGLIDEIVKTAAIARKEGVLALEQNKGALRNSFFKKSIHWITSGHELQGMKEMMSHEIHHQNQVYAGAENFFERMGVLLTFLIVVVVIFALTGAAQVLPDFEKFSVLLSTGLGAATVPLCLSFLVFRPMVNKVADLKARERVPREIVYQGVVGILEATSPAFLEEKLKLIARG